MTKESTQEKSTLVQIMNEVDELTDAEKSFVLYWLRAKKYAVEAVKADATISQNNITMADILRERNAARKLKMQ